MARKTRRVERAACRGLGRYEAVRMQVTSLKAGPASHLGSHQLDIPSWPASFTDWCWRMRDVVAGQCPSAAAVASRYLPSTGTSSSPMGLLVLGSVPAVPPAFSSPHVHHRPANPPALQITAETCPSGSFSPTQDQRAQAHSLLMMSPKHTLGIYHPDLTASLHTVSAPDGELLPVFQPPARSPCPLASNRPSDLCSRAELTRTSCPRRQAPIPSAKTSGTAPL